MDIIFSIIHFLYSTCQFSSITIDTFASFANEIERERNRFKDLETVFPSCVSRFPVNSATRREVLIPRKEGRKGFSRNGGVARLSLSLSLSLSVSLSLVHRLS